MNARRLLEETLHRDPGVIDENIDTREPLDGGLHCCLRVGAACHIELHHEQPVGAAEGRRDGARVATGGYDGISRGQRGPDEVGAHPATGACDEPDLLASPHGAIIRRSRI
jgi:hypothetical protein